MPGQTTKPESPVRLGSLLKAIGRQAKLSEEEWAVFISATRRDEEIPKREESVAASYKNPPNVTVNGVIDVKRGQPDVFRTDADAIRPLIFAGKVSN